MLLNQRIAKGIVRLSIWLWLLVAGVGILLARDNPSTLTEMFVYSLVVPILVASFSYGRGIGLLVALLSGLLSGSLAVGQPEMLQSPIVQRVLFQIIFFNVVALVTGSLVEREQESRAQLQIIRDSAHMGSVLIEAETYKIVDINRYAAEMIGLPREQIIGQRCYKFFCPSCGGECPIKNIKHPMDTPERILLKANGTVVPIHKTVKPLILGGQKHYIESFLDITERVKTEEALQESEEKYREFIEGTGDLITQVDDKGQLTYVNHIAEEVFGIPTAECLGKVAFDFVHPDDLNRTEKWFEKCLGEHSEQGFIENRQVNQSTGDVFHFLWTCNFHYDKENQPKGVNGIAHDITERKEFEHQLQHAATHDSLTDLPNRALFNDRLSHALATAKRNEKKLAVLFLDLDDFKTVNDTYGHHIGDQLLIAFAKRLEGIFRKSDTFARLSGDEFAVILETISSHKDVAKIAQKTIALCSTPYKLDGNDVLVMLSMGISIYPEDGRDADTLLQRADAAMYRAKEQGEGSFLFTNELS